MRTLALVVGEYGRSCGRRMAETAGPFQASGTTQTLWAVSFSDANNGTAVGEGGNDRWNHGRWAHWASQASGTTLQLRGVSFTDANMERLSVRVARFSEPLTAETAGPQS